MSTRPAGRSAIALVWLHAALFAAVAAACYASPETVFGAAAWLPLARLAVLLLAAAMATAAVLFVGGASSASRAQIGAALLAALAFDVQAPVLMFARPASLEYLERELAVRWWAVPQVFLLLVAVTTFTVVSETKKGTDLFSAGQKRGQIYFPSAGP